MLCVIFIARLLLGNSPTWAQTTQPIGTEAERARVAVGLQLNFPNLFLDGEHPFSFWMERLANLHAAQEKLGKSLTRSDSLLRISLQLYRPKSQPLTIDRAVFAAFQARAKNLAPRLSSLESYVNTHQLKEALTIVLAEASSLYDEDTQEFFRLHDSDKIDFIERRLQNNVSFNGQSYSPEEIIRLFKDCVEREEIATLQALEILTAKKVSEWSPNDLQSLWRRSQDPKSPISRALGEKLPGVHKGAGLARIGKNVLRLLRRLGTPSLQSPDAQALEPWKKITWVEMPPEIAMASGEAGSDCSSTRAAAFALCPSERYFFGYLEGKDTPVAYVEISEGKSGNERAWFLNTLNGAKLSSDFVLPTYQAFAQAARKLGFKKFLVQPDGKAKLFMNFESQYAELKRLNKEGKRAPFRYDNAGVREQLQPFVETSVFHHPDFIDSAWEPDSLTLDAGVSVEVLERTRPELEHEYKPSLQMYLRALAAMRVDSYSRKRYMTAVLDAIQRDYPNDLTTARWVASPDYRRRTKANYRSKLVQLFGEDFIQHYDWLFASDFLRCSDSVAPENLETSARLAVTLLRSSDSANRVLNELPSSITDHIVSESSAFYAALSHDWDAFFKAQGRAYPILNYALRNEHWYHSFHTEFTRLFQTTPTFNVNAIGKVETNQGEYTGVLLSYSNSMGDLRVSISTLAEIIDIANTLAHRATSKELPAQVRVQSAIALKNLAVAAASLPTNNANKAMNSAQITTLAQKTLGGLIIELLKNATDTSEHLFVRAKSLEALLSSRLLQEFDKEATSHLAVLKHFLASFRQMHKHGYNFEPSEFEVFFNLTSFVDNPIDADTSHWMFETSLKFQYPLALLMRKFATGEWTASSDIIERLKEISDETAEQRALLLLIRAQHEPEARERIIEYLSSPSRAFSIVGQEVIKNLDQVLPTLQGDPAIASAIHHAALTLPVWDGQSWLTMLRLAKIAYKSNDFHKIRERIRHLEVSIEYVVNRKSHSDTSPYKKVFERTWVPLDATTVPERRERVENRDALITDTLVETTRNAFFPQPTDANIGASDSKNMDHCASSLTP